SHNPLVRSVLLQTRGIFWVTRDTELTTANSLYCIRGPVVSGPVWLSTWRCIQYAQDVRDRCVFGFGPGAAISGSRGWLQQRIFSRILQRRSYKLESAEYAAELE